MKREDIIRMAREAGGWETDTGELVTDEINLERFFQAAYAAGASAEREACAKVCDEYSAVGKIEEFDRGWLACAKAISNVIRAKGQA